MHFTLLSILLYFILTFAAFWIIDLKNTRDSVENKFEQKFYLIQDISYPESFRFIHIIYLTRYYKIFVVTFAELKFTYLINYGHLLWIK